MTAPHSSGTCRLVVFDVDGTLVDSQAHILAAMSYAFDAIGLPTPSREAVLSVVGLSLPLAVERLVPDLDTAHHAELVEHYMNSFAEIRTRQDPAAMSPLFPGARAALDRLLARDDILVGIATGKSRRGLDHLLRTHGLTGAFVTEQVADFHPSKPHPAMLAAALEETGVAAANAVMIGDTSYDMEMACAAGVRRIGVGWGYHPVEQLIEAGADLVIDDFTALDGALAAIWEG